MSSHHTMFPADHQSRPGEATTASTPGGEERSGGDAPDEAPHSVHQQARRQLHLQRGIKLRADRLGPWFDDESGLIIRSPDQPASSKLASFRAPVLRAIASGEIHPTPTSPGTRTAWPSPRHRPVAAARSTISAMQPGARELALSQAPNRHSPRAPQSVGSRLAIAVAFPALGCRALTHSPSETPDTRWRHVGTDTGSYCLLRAPGGAVLSRY